MATKRKIGGYAWNDHVSRALSANREAREVVRQFLSGRRLGETTQAVLLARLTQALATEMDALAALREIGRGSEG